MSEMEARIETILSKWWFDQHSADCAAEIALLFEAERNRCLSIIKSIEPHNPSEAHLLETIARRVRGEE